MNFLCASVVVLLLAPIFLNPSVRADEEKGENVNTDSTEKAKEEKIEKITTLNTDQHKTESVKTTVKIKRNKKSKPDPKLRSEDSLSSLAASCNKGKNGFYEPSKIMVSLLISVKDGYKHVCSGVILNENHVLTSGSCMKIGGERPDSVVEMWKMEAFMDEHQQEDIIYNGDVTPVIAWFISQIEAAVLKLGNPIQEGLLVHYAHLPGNEVSGVFHNFCPSIISMGWGFKKNKPSKYLQCVEVLRLPDDVCKEACTQFIEQGQYAYDKELTFCTVSSNNTQVDVGSPLICNGYMVFAMTIASEDPSLPQLNFRVDKELTFIYNALGNPKKRLGMMRSAGCDLNMFYFKYVSFFIVLVCITVN
ncbi:unnamed protein product [Psylliodes chrysocephalus]|uniref:Peptidase S1 domain-containing protein n=1 Tax=Psylliodes chrysocephalus TaxID=3402493 RepID=A0A9P0GDH4_9CUCU|nr:unnamed protein product [Psylliodes chrysocephala]